MISVNRGIAKAGENDRHRRNLRHAKKQRLRRFRLRTHWG